MKAISIVVFLWSTMLNISSNGQIKGAILEMGTNTPLKGVMVFINNSTFSDLTDSNGEFEIIGVPEGFYTLVLFKNGYELFKSPIRIQSGILSTVSLSLNPSVETKKYDHSKKRSLSDSEFKLFVNQLLGESKHSGQCHILNPKALKLLVSDSSKVISAAEPVIIQNEALGYKITLFMSDLELDGKSTWTGLMKMDTLSMTKTSRINDWYANQFDSYKGSMQHFFKTLVENNSSGHEFDVFDSDGNKLGTNSIAVHDKISALYRISLTEKFRVVYVANSSSIPQVSWVIPNGKIGVNSNGVVLDLNSVNVIGKMNRALPERLPDNYDIDIIKAYDQRIWEGLKQLQERVYVQTDRPYYYPGEVVWMKAYMDYSQPAMRDSLSKVLYLDLVDSLNNLVETRTLEIDSGFAKGEYILPDTLAPANYFLLGYTNYMRNFGMGSLFKKSIPILNFNDQPDPRQSFTEDNGSSSFTVTANKPSYGTREKIQLIIHLKDILGNPLGAMVSVSVTDTKEVIPIKEKITILKDYKLSQSGVRPTIESLRYPIEFGISFLGEYISHMSKRKPDKLNVIQGNFENMMEVELDDNGIFWVDGFNFYDTTTLSFQVNNRISKGGVNIIERKRPAFEWRGLSEMIKLDKVDNPRNRISNYALSKRSRMLEEVTIRATKMEESTEIRTYGRADYILKMDDLGPIANNLAMALQGKIPGVSIYPMWDNLGLHYVIRMGRQQSIQGNLNPLIMIDDVPMSGNAGDILQNIDATSIETIEVTTHLNSLYGEAGRAGVISFYTRKGPRKSGPEEKKAQLVVLKGYDRPNSFEAPLYDRESQDASLPDYRATIYWNPDIKLSAQTGNALVSFFSADLHTTYRVVVEGVTVNGDPIRTTLPIIVK